MKLQYRAIEGTNTKTRRLAYLTAILLILRQEVKTYRSAFWYVSDYSYRISTSGSYEEL